MGSGNTIAEKIREGVDKLPEKAREELYRYLKYLEYRESLETNTKSGWAALGGAIGKEEADELKKIIAEGCENIDENEW